MKAKIKYFVFTLLLLLSMATCIQANTGGFGGTVNSSWGYVDMNGVLCRSYFYSTNVKWNYSSQSAAHNMWFRVVNSNGEQRGSSMLTYLQNKNFSNTCSTNYRYYLQSRRENSIDPSTTVSGEWTI